MVDTALDRWGRIDILVSNAGISVGDINAPRRRGTRASTSIFTAS
ncbi:hypothetical protein ACU686_16500 [Yinghuangia aomiensis]